MHKSWTHGLAFAVLLGAVVAPGDASAERAAKRTPLREGKPVARVVSVTYADLPREDIPPMLDDAKAPSEVKQGQPELSDLRLQASNDSDASKLKSLRSSRRTGPGSPDSSSISVKLSVPGRIFGHRVNTGYGGASTFWAQCGGYRSTYGSRPFAIRWETAKVVKTGELEMTVSDGWYDPFTCEVSQVRRTVVHPKVVAQANEAPAMWALRTSSDELMLMLPWTSLMSVDGGTTAAKVEVGLLTRVLLPVKRGSASSLAAVFQNDYSFRQWGQTVAAGALAQAAAGMQSASFGVDVIQTVSDPAPGITIRITGESTDVKGDSFFER